jgi:hypothetical protein
LPVRISTRPVPAMPRQPICPQGADANDKNSGMGREALGRSRGGLSTKIHLVADRRCRPIARILSPGQHGDSPRFIPLMDSIHIKRRGPGRPRKRPGRAMGDKAYSSRANRAYLRRRQSCHPGQGRPEGQPPQARLKRWPAAGLRPGDLQGTQHR